MLTIIEDIATSLVTTMRLRERTWSFIVYSIRVQRTMSSFVIVHHFPSLVPMPRCVGVRVSCLWMQTTEDIINCLDMAEATTFVTSSQQCGV